MPPKRSKATGKAKGKTSTARRIVSMNVGANKNRFQSSAGCTKPNQIRSPWTKRCVAVDSVAGRRLMGRAAIKFVDGKVVRAPYFQDPSRVVGPGEDIPTFTVGSKLQVWNGTAHHTSGGVTRDGLIKKCKTVQRGKTAGTPACRIIFKSRSEATTRAIRQGKIPHPNPTKRMIAAEREYGEGGRWEGMTHGLGEIARFKPGHKGHARRAEWVRNQRVKPRAALHKYIAPCPDGKVRDPKTQRCRAPKAVARASVKKARVAKRKPCPDGKVRNAKTKRCRAPKAVARATAKKARAEKTKRTPCPDGKVRDPKTKRCRAPKTTGKKATGKAGKKATGKAGKKATGKAGKKATGRTMTTRSVTAAQKAAAAAKRKATAAAKKAGRAGYMPEMTMGGGYGGGHGHGYGHHRMHHHHAAAMSPDMGMGGGYGYRH